MASIDQLSDLIAKELQTYTRKVKQGVVTASEDSSKEAVRLLKKNSPRGASKKYYKGWTRSRKGDGYIVHNKDHYRRTHLLEHGHAKADGGTVDAIPHIAPVEKEVCEAFENKVKEVIQS